MKKYIAVLLLTVLLCSCNKIPQKQTKRAEHRNNSVVGVWLTYNEMDNILSSYNPKAEFTAVADNCKSFGITDVFIHTVPFCNSYYNSKFIPLCEKAENIDFDIPDFLTDIFHKRNIKVHAWINPYRVRTADSNIKKLNKKSPAYIWLNDKIRDNDKNICFSNGIYLNPAEKDVKTLIINTVREITDKYSFDGVHIDDYFYPTVSPDFDKISYNEYKNSVKSPLSLNDYRKANVTSLISQMYSVLKSKKIVFSISPSADIGRNEVEMFADVTEFCKTPLCDMIIPQIYFGFEYPDKNYRFLKLLRDWENLNSEGKTKLVIGLASYKLGTTNEPDNAEWERGEDIIKRQVEMLNSDGNISGYVFFSYSSLFSDSELNRVAREKITEVLR